MPPRYAKRPIMAGQDAHVLGGPVSERTSSASGVPRGPSGIAPSWPVSGATTERCSVAGSVGVRYWPQVEFVDVLEVRWVTGVERKVV